ncbi:hypothetical protein C8Q78DRAFT_564595 [Trametes maxima]|nr:hypothetical protein C8Q78DRAFT_564595 [Trametes maxima]
MRRDQGRVPGSIAGREVSQCDLTSRLGEGDPGGEPRRRIDPEPDGRRRGTTTGGESGRWPGAPGGTRGQRDAVREFQPRARVPRVEAYASEGSDRVARCVYTKCGTRGETRGAQKMCVGCGRDISPGRCGVASGGGG